MADTIDIISESLNFPEMRRRAVASRNYRIKISPSNGSVFTPSQTMNLELPANLACSYVDFSNLYLKFAVTYTCASADAYAYLDKPGAYSFLQRIQILTGGSSVFDLNNYSTLVGALLDTDVGGAYKCNAGNILAGLNGSKPVGELVGGVNGAVYVRTYCIPLILTPFANQKKLVPLFSADALRFKIVLDTVVNALITPVSGADLVTNYSVNDVELCGYITELSASAQQNMDRMTQGVYNLLTPTWSNFQSSMVASAGVQSVTATIGIACSSLERVFVIHRPTAAQIAGNATLGNRITNGLNSWSLLINGASYPDRLINVQTATDGACAEAFAELLISDHSLSDFSKSSGVQMATIGLAGTVAGVANMASYVNNTEAVFDNQLVVATNAAGVKPWGAAYTLGLPGIITTVTDSSIGSFVASLELESGVSAGKSDRLYSGQMVIGKSVQYRGNYNANSIACSIDFFCQYSVLLTLNMRQQGIWQMSV